MCTNDEVVIWDSAGSSSDLKQQEGRLCGRELTPLYFFSTQNALTVQFTSDRDSAGASGFQASVEFVTTHVCVVDKLVHLVQDNGAYLLSPNFPHNPRELGSCMWRVEKSFRIICATCVRKVFGWRKS